MYIKELKTSKPQSLIKDINNNLLVKLKLKFICLELQQNLQQLFNIKFKLFITDTLKFLSISQKVYNIYMFQYISKIRLQNLNNQYNDFINLFSLSLFFRVPSLFLNYLVYLFPKFKKQSSFILLLKKLFKEFFRLIPQFKGVQLCIKGKFNKATRTKSVIFKEGKLNLTLKTPNILYAYKFIVMFSGSFGFKL